ncbi:hypothetical protein PJI17_19920 [Mycobacterium kansasii]
MAAGACCGSMGPAVGRCTSVAPGMAPVDHGHEPVGEHIGSTADRERPGSDRVQRLGLGIGTQGGRYESGWGSD